MLKALMVVCFALNKLEVVTGKYDIFIQDYLNVMEKSNFTRAIGDVIYAHTDFDIIIHFDDANWNLVDQLMADINSRTTKSANLICYNEGVANSNLFERPLVRKILNVIILQDLEHFALFSNTTENVNEHDEALFIIPNLDANTTFLVSDWHVKLFGKILVINFDLNKNVTINTICYFCGTTTRKLVRLSISPKLTFDKKEFRDFNEHVFKLGFTEYYPFIWCEQIEETVADNITFNVCTKVKGSESELIAIMAQRLNFKFTLLMYSRYTALIDDLEQGKVDFVVGGITATSQRAERTTFTRQYWFEGYHFLYVLSANMNQELARVLDPFDGNLWLLLATSVFVTAAVLYALDRVESTEIGRISCSESLWVCLEMVMEQNVNIKQVFKVRPGPAILLVAWILVCLNVSTAYKSKLSALVMNPPHREPNDMEQLVENDYKFVVNDKYRDVFEALLINTTDPLVQVARGITDVRSGICEEFIYAVENRIAILDEYTSLQYELRRTCGGELRAKRADTEGVDGTHIRITRKSLRVIGQVWLLQKRAAYRSGFDEVLGRIVEAGLVQIWRRNYTKGMIKGEFPESHNGNTEHYHSPLSLRLLLSLFLLYGVGNSCAIFAFAAESICYNTYVISAHRKSSLPKND